VKFTRQSVIRDNHRGYRGYRSSRQSWALCRKQVNCRDCRARRPQSMLATLILVVMTLATNGCLSQQSGTDQLNVYGRPLQICSLDPLTGWFRDGYARTDSYDRGLHTVCAEMTSQFLDYTKRLGNDLSTPRGSFPGLNPGDKWALCAVRWKEAFRAEKAPKVFLEATNIKALDVVNLRDLEQMDSRGVVGRDIR